MSRDKPKSKEIDGTGMRFAIVAARFNQSYVDELLGQVLKVLDGAGVAGEDIETVRVPGSNETPYVAGMLARTLDFDCIICLGLVIAGETPHHEIIAHSTGFALQEISTNLQIPVINGIVVVNNEEQAEARCRGELNRGREFGLAALEMSELARMLSSRVDELQDAIEGMADALGIEEDDLWEDDDEEDWKR